MDKPQSGRRESLRASVILPIVTFVLAAITIALTGYEGQRRGLDYIYAAGPDGEQSAITIAISDLVYGLNAGYLGFASVKENLVANWPPGGTKARNELDLDHARLKAQQNAAIRSAASMPPPKPGYLSDRSLMSMVYDDTGYVDFVKLSFRLFGMNMEAMHYTFLVLLSISAVAFLLTFRSDAVAQTVLLCTLFAFYIEIQIGHFNYTTTLSGMRHGSTLSLIPMWHFVFLLLRRRPFNFAWVRSMRLQFPLPSLPWKSLATLVLALIQLAILVLALRMRGSAIWTVMFIVSLAVLLATVPYWRQRLRTWPLLSVMRGVAAWPVVVLLGGLVVNNLSLNAALHPVYFTDDVIPYHGLWHSAIIGMRYSPHMLPERSAATVRSGGSLDASVYYAVEEYLDRIHFLQKPSDPSLIIPTYISPWTNTVKFRLHDNISRRVFFEIAAKHPWDMLVLYVYKKPLAIVRGTLFQISQAPDMLWVALIILGGAISACIWQLLGEAESTRIGMIALLAAAPIPFAALPNIWAFSEIWTLTDYYLAILLFLQIAVAALGVFAVRQVSRYRNQTSTPATS
jgi:hypothetical protein